VPRQPNCTTGCVFGIATLSEPETLALDAEGPVSVVSFGARHRTTVVPAT